MSSSSSSRSSSSSSMSSSHRGTRLHLWLPGLLLSRRPHRQQRISVDLLGTTFTRPALSHLQPHPTNPRAIERNNFATKRLIVKKVAKLLRFRVCSKMTTNPRGFALLCCCCCLCRWRCLCRWSGDRRDPGFAARDCAHCGIPRYGA